MSDDQDEAINFWEGIPEADDPHLREVPSASDFLDQHPAPVIAKDGRSTDTTLLRRYLLEVEPHYRYHFRGGHPRYYSDLSDAYQDPMGDYPRDWKWRSFAVKHAAHFLCSECINSGSPMRLRASDLHTHHCYAARSLREELEPESSYDIDIPEGPHSFQNLLCVCVMHHEALHGRVFNKAAHGRRF